MTQTFELKELIDAEVIADLINRGCVKARMFREGARNLPDLFTYTIPPNVSSGNAADVRLCAKRFFSVDIADDKREFIARALTGPEVQALILLGADMDSFYEIKERSR